MPDNHYSIGQLAYMIWEARGRPEGDPEADWYQAQQQLMRRDVSAADATPEAITELARGSH